MRVRVPLSARNCLSKSYITKEIVTVFSREKEANRALLGDFRELTFSELETLIDSPIGIVLGCVA